MTAMNDAVALAEACDDTNECQRAIVKVLEELGSRGEEDKAFELAKTFLPRLAAAQRRHEVELLLIHDELAREIRT